MRLPFADREEAGRDLAAHLEPLGLDRPVVLGVPRGGVLVAVPVAPMEGVGKVRPEYDEVVCPHTPHPYLAVGQWYVDFHQVTDDEVRTLLRTGG